MEYQHAVGIAKLDMLILQILKKQRIQIIYWLNLIVTGIVEKQMNFGLI